MIVALNFAPELTGIGKYVGEMTEYLTSSGFDVRVITAPPYYPEWRVGEGYSATAWRKECRHAATVFRCPLYVPKRRSGLHRIVHLASFALSSLPVIFWQAIRWRPEVIWVVEPTLGYVPASWLAGRLVRARLWLHVQDFEVDAAFGLGLVRSGFARRIAQAVESWLMRRFDRVTSISGSMVARLASKRVPAHKLGELPNWVDVQRIRPVSRENPLRAELGIPADRLVLLYSGNMGEKQGLEMIVEAARSLADHASLLFLMCGEGVARARIEKLAAGLPNMRFMPLQPLERLNELLSLSDIHLLPQRAGIEDLVLPSKLTGILASARPVVAAAPADSDLAQAAAAGGLVVAPGDANAFAAALKTLCADATLRERLGAQGRAYAVARWDRQTVLGKFCEDLNAVM
ncbi:MAG: glycosyltransferase WbuB [Nevskiaceae bacterium]|jgi:colanic acid biosynthesis glycosyl transferase WcaI|nr:glycosyltransferase WbuB [Nevskiaceae bacterium]